MKYVGISLVIFSIVVAIDQVQGQISFADVVNKLQNVKNDLKNDMLNLHSTADIFLKDNVQNLNLKLNLVEKEPLAQLIEKQGYPAETHYILTEDGYNISALRIPHGKYNETSNGKVVLLQHGFLSSPVDWVLFGPDHGLAYLLADQGYDVWMGTFRGGENSRGHLTLTPKNPKYWSFSFHEAGIYDLAAIIDYILNATGQKNLYNIAYNEGTTAFFVLCSMKPEYNEKIRLQISLGPLAYMGNVVSPVLRAAATSTIGQESLFQLGNMEFAPNNALLSKLGERICATGEGKVLCKNVMFAIAGFSPKQVNASSLPLITTYYPSPSSAKTGLHYIQEINSRRFCQFDYGPLNFLHYQAAISPSYKLSKVTAPVIVMYSHNDWLTNEIDVLQLCRELGNVKDKYRVPHESWSHADFVIGKDAPTVVYSKVFSYLDTY